MAFRGRGRGRGGFQNRRYARELEFPLFPDVELPNQKNVARERSLVIWSNKLELFWKNSPYHLKRAASKESQGPDIERYSDRNEQRNKIGSCSLQDYLELRKDNFPLELMGKLQLQKKKQVRWDPDSDLLKFDMFEKMEQKYQGREEKDGKEKKEGEDEVEGEEIQNEEEESSDDDYNQNIDFDDDEDDYNLDEPNDDEPFYE